MLNDIRLVLWIIGAIALLALLWDGLKRHHENRKRQEKDRVHQEQQLLEKAVAEAARKAAEQQALHSEELLSETESTSAANTETEKPGTFLEEQDIPSDPEKAEPSMPDLSVPNNEESTVKSEETAISKTESSNETAMAEPIIFTLKANERYPFSGFRLLHILLKLGFHFNANKHWFDYHSNQDKHQPVLFSLVAATKTGQFDITNMANFSCKGLIVFFEPVHVIEPLKSFEEMILVTEKLAHELVAEIFIRQDEPWDDAQIEKLRQICGSIH